MVSPWTRILFVAAVHLCVVNCHLRVKPDIEDQKFETIVQIIKVNLKTNGWDNILCLGDLPNTLYSKLRHLGLSISVSYFTQEDYQIDDVVPNYSNFIIISCSNFSEFGQGLRRAFTIPYYHPLSNTIIYISERQNKQALAKIFFILWFYKMSNSIVVNYDDSERIMRVTHYNPFSSDKYRLQNNYGCWTAKKIGMAFSSYEEGFVCVDGCHNVSLNSKFRANNLGTCVGFNTYDIKYGETESIAILNLFEDRAINLHGFALRAFVTEVQPFLKIDVHGEGNYTIHARDGMVWNVLSELMNFTIDLSPSVKVMKQVFNFEVNIQQIYSFSHRKADLFLIPIYLFDMIIVNIDQSYPYRASGVCLMSHRAGFETVLFNAKLIKDNYMLVIRFIIAFFCIWFTFYIYDFRTTTNKADKVGFAFSNTVKNILSIPFAIPSTKRAFRLFLTATIWGCFVFNFATQAAIVSFLAATKRGKEVETFEDVINYGYDIEGMASPDVVLPETEEKFRKINSKLVARNDLFDCVNKMANDSRRFCLIDCSVGQYVARNQLKDGQQYLHIVGEKIHSHYLNFIFPKNSFITSQVNKYMMILVESGLINKWEQYRYPRMKGDNPFKQLNMDDLIGIFKAWGGLVFLSIMVFIFEIFTTIFKVTYRYFSRHVAAINKRRKVKKDIKLLRKFGKIKQVTSSTQTI